MLYTLLPTFGKRERNELLRWVASPVANSRPEVTNLCIFLCEHISVGAETPEPADKTALYRATFEREPAAIGRLSAKEDAALRHIVSFLLECVRQWMIWREARADPAESGFYLCRSLRRRGLREAFDKEFKKINQPDAHSMQSADYYRLQYQLQLEQWEMRYSGAASTDLQTLCASFGCYVAVSTLRHGCAALDKPTGRASLPDIDYLPETLAAVERGRYADVPAVQVYYYCLHLMETGREPHFWALKALLTEHRTRFPTEEIRDVWMVVINYCIKRVNAGDRTWVKEAFGLYRTGVETAIILDRGRLSKQTYQNIMLLAIASDEWDWARQFLEEYRHTLATGERYNAYNFNLALWHFRKNEYLQAQEILRRVEFRDVQYNLDARRILVRIYYDQGEYEALESLLHSFRIYLQRHRNIGYHRELNLHFVRAVRRLLQLRPGDAAAARQFCEKVRAERYIAERDWLLERVTRPNAWAACS